MMLYPIHQNYGRFTGSTLLALERTDIIRNLTVINTITGLIFVYFLLAPNSFIVPGLELGATGLALKMVIHQIISVNIYLFFCCRLIEERMGKYLLNQVVTLLPIFVIGFIVKNVIDLIYNQNPGITESMIHLIISASIYGSLVLIMIWVFPNIAGISRDDIKYYMHKLKR